MKIYDEYDFPSEYHRILGRALKDDGYHMKEGDLVVLAPTGKLYYHPVNCYVYSIQTGKWFGRYFIRDFEVIQEFSSIEELHRYTCTSIQSKSTEPEESEDQFEQLSLF